MSPFAWGTVMVEADVLATELVAGSIDSARLRVVGIFRGHPAADIDVRLPVGPSMSPGDRVYVALDPSTNPVGAYRYAATFLRRIEGPAGQAQAMTEEHRVVVSVSCPDGFGTAPSDVSGFGLTTPEIVAARIAEARNAMEWSAAMAAVRACASAVPVRP